MALAEGADLLVCESTFADEEVALARQWKHLTASDAARTARDAGARRLVLTHFSQRYPDTRKLVDQAAAIFPDVVAAEDLLRYPSRPVARSPVVALRPGRAARPRSRAGGAGADLAMTCSRPKMAG